MGCVEGHIREGRGTGAYPCCLLRGVSCLNEFGQFVL